MTNTQMKYGEVPGVGKPISRLVQGSIQIDMKNEEAAFTLLDAAFERGINSVDTAHIYGGGMHDRVIGKWINSRGIRDKVVVLAKGAHHSGDRKRVTPYDIGADLHDTLARMKTDYVDLYVLHRDDADYPVEAIVDALNQYAREGKIKAFGGSNWTAARLQAANEYAKQSGQIPFAVSSPNFSLADQVKEPWAGCTTISGPSYEAERKWYAETGMALFTWSSMAGGFMSGRITRENTEEYTEGLYKLAVECYASEANFQRLDRAKEVAEQKGLTMPQIALAYVMNYPLNIFALVGSASPEELDANIAAVNTPLTEQELAYLDLRADSPA
jgi:aryl-alcohol dehydrogenase-like predicted oxidoreductase